MYGFPHSDDTSYSWLQLSWAADFILFMCLIRIKYDEKRRIPGTPVVTLIKAQHWSPSSLTNQCRNNAPQLSKVQ